MLKFQILYLRNYYQQSSKRVFFKKITNICKGYQIRMDQKEIVDELYQENLNMGHRINVLNDENNFYRIQINNFNKLTNSINKDLIKLGLNFQKNERTGDIVKVGPLFVISNKIKLKNLQMKVGNQIRQADRFKKNLEGSLPILAKKIEKLQGDIDELIKRCTEVELQNRLLANLEAEQKEINQVYGDYQMFSDKNYTLNDLDCMIECDLDSTKVIQQLKKEQKQKTKFLHELQSINGELRKKIENLKKYLPDTEETTYLNSLEAQELQKLQQAENKLLEDIKKEKKELETQYTINSECKQRIQDRKEQQNKEIKVLEEEVAKCRQQVKEVRSKYNEIMANNRKRELLKKLIL